ncbi:MAG: helicase C-terminal domain-containing protein [Candidatus Pacearchaeota archaeon]|jgi:Rad3-related DNA helicase
MATQLTFNADGSIKIPREIENDVPEFEDLKSQAKELDIWDFTEKIDFDEKHYNLEDEVFGFNLYEDGRKLKPLIFSNGKSQEDVFKEILKNINNGKRVIFVRGVCGTGKSAIALNLAKELGKTSIVVPGKALQKQYALDYSKSKYILKNDHKKLKISIITGRENHSCLYSKGCSANDQNLPCKIEIKEGNVEFLQRYLKENNRDPDLEVKDIRRISIAPACPYWSPIVPSEYEFPLGAKKKIKYAGLNGIDFTIYNRKEGCGYYGQFNSYVDAEAIVFNSMKYKLESLMNRKPQTEVEIIDECDEFLDSFSNVKRINFARFFNALLSLNFENSALKVLVKSLYNLVSDVINDEYTKHLANTGEIIKLKNTKLYEILNFFLKNSALVDSLDEENYIHSVVEIALEFEELFDDTFVTFSQEERGIIANVATVSLSKKFEELLDKNKFLVLMSGTIHSVGVLRDIFGITDFVTVDAETINQGSVEVKYTGLEMDCKYENFASGNFSRQQYLEALDKCVEIANKPVLIHVNAFEDLPTIGEKSVYNLKNLIAREKLYETQQEDRENKIVEKFKNKSTDVLFTTKCNRGVDFPGDQCRSIIFTKYPNPNVQSVFWKMLKKTHPQYYWEFYKDKARREFLQKLYRGVRSKDDHISLLSPDIRVLNAANLLGF